MTRDGEAGPQGTGLSTLHPHDTHREYGPQSPADDWERGARVANVAWFVMAGHLPRPSHVQRLRRLQAANVLMDERGFQAAASFR